MVGGRGHEGVVGGRDLQGLALGDYHMGGHLEREEEETEGGGGGGGRRGRSRRQTRKRVEEKEGGGRRGEGREVGRRDGG